MVVKQRDAALNFDANRNFRRHRTVLPAIARLSYFVSVHSWIMRWDLRTAQHYCIVLCAVVTDSAGQHRMKCNGHLTQTHPGEVAVLRTLPSLIWAQTGRSAGSLSPSISQGLSTLATKVAENGDKKYPFPATNGYKWILFVTVFGDFCRQCGQAFSLSGAFVGSSLLTLSSSLSRSRTVYCREKIQYYSSKIR